MNVNKQHLLAAFANGTPITIGKQAYIIHSIERESGDNKSYNLRCREVNGNSIRTIFVRAS